VSRGDRFRAWLVTGPVGRVVGFVLELGFQLWQGARRGLGYPRDH
jgi:hypothetical protein